jgi:hypothetical protein
MQDYGNSRQKNCYENRIELNIYGACLFLLFLSFARCRCRCAWEGLRRRAGG